MIRTANLKLSFSEAEYLLTILRERIDAKHAEISVSSNNKRIGLIDELTFIANLNVKVKDAAIDAFPRLDSLTIKI